MNDFSHSESESKVFGLQVYRSRVEQFDAAFLTDNFLKDGVDVVISRFNTSLQTRIFELCVLIPNSFLADTLVYYASNFGDRPRFDFPENICISEVGPSEMGIVGDLIQRIFPNYTNHYHSNPFFKGLDLAKGYLEWTRPFLTDQDKICLLLYDSGVPCGFLTARIYQEEGYADIILNGVLKEYEGQGKYSYLLRALKNNLLQRQLFKVLVSTQLTNQRVQKVWTKEQFYLEKSYYTFHHFTSTKAISALKSAN